MKVNEIQQFISTNRTNTCPTSDNTNGNCYSAETESTLYPTDNLPIRGKEESDQASPAARDDRFELLVTKSHTEEGIKGGAR